MMVLGAPDLTLHQSVPYVAGAYIVFLTVVLVYVAIMAVRQRRTERSLAELRREVEAHAQPQDDVELHAVDGGSALPEATAHR